MLTVLVLLAGLLPFIAAERKPNIGVITWASETALSQFAGTLRNVADYADARKYDRIVNTTQYNFQQDPHGFCENSSNQASCRARSPYWFKPYMLRDACRAHPQYEYFMYVDADMAINRRDVGVEDFVQRAGSSSVLIASFMGARVNAGVFIIKGGSECVAFVDSWVDQHGFYADDNGALNHALLAFRNPNYDGRCATIAAGIRWYKLRGVSPADVGSELQQAYAKVDECLMEGYGLRYGADADSCDCKDTAVSPSSFLICPQATATHVPLQSEDFYLAVYRGRVCAKSLGRNSAAVCNVHHSFSVHSKKLKRCNDVPACLKNICSAALDPVEAPPRSTPALAMAAPPVVAPSEIVLPSSLPPSAARTTLAADPPEDTAVSLPLSHTEFHLCRLYDEAFLGKARDLRVIGRFSFSGDPVSPPLIRSTMNVGVRPKHNFDLENARSLQLMVTQSPRHGDMSEDEFRAFLEQGGWRGLLKQCTEQRLPIYYWNSKKAGGWSIANFGDAVNVEVAKGLLGLSEPAFTSAGVQTPKERAAGKVAPSKILMVGSVLLNANPGDVIWGSGLHFDTNATYKFPYSGGLDVRAVRGPLSASVLGAISEASHPHLTFGDPAMLLPLFHRLDDMLQNERVPGSSRRSSSGSSEKTYCVVPHYVDIDGVKLTPRQRKLAKLMPGRMTFPIDGSEAEGGANEHRFQSPPGWRLRILSPGLEAGAMVDAMLEGCDLVLSSSLHGVIFGEMYRIPSRWLFNADLFLSSRVESSLKYNDYFLSTGRSCFQPATSLADGVAVGGLQPYSVRRWATLVKNLLLTYPYERVCSEATAAKVDFNTLYQHQRFVKSTRQLKVPGHSDAFNPSIATVDGHLVLSYRSRIRKPDGPIQDNANTIGVTLVAETADDSLTVVGEPTSVLEFQNPYCTSPSRAHDPRLVSLGGRLVTVYSNLYAMELIYRRDAKRSLFKDTRRMFLSVIDLPGTGGKSEMALDSPRVVTSFEGDSETWTEQKNWIPFVYERRLYFVQSIAPHHRVVGLLANTKSRLTAPTYYITTPKLQHPPAESIPAAAGGDASGDVGSGPHSAPHLWRWGELRGGTQAVLLPGGSEYISVFHSSAVIKTVHSGGEVMQHYFMGAYTFSATPPFAITRISREPIFAPGMYDSPSYPTYKPIRCVFASGLHISEAKGQRGGGAHNMYIVFGKQDYEAWVATLDLEVFLLDNMVAVDTATASAGEEEVSWTVSSKTLDYHKRLKQI